VLPHAGGGGEAYVDSLERMTGYSHTRFFLATGREPLAAIPSLASKVPRVNLFARRFDIVHVHGEVSAFFCLPALALAPSVLTLHGLNLVRRSTGVAGSLASSNLKLIARAATRTICVSETERDEVADLIGARLAENLVVVSNGVPRTPHPSADDRRSIRAELRVEDQVVALSVGALDPPKDPVTLATAAVSLARSGSKVVLLLVGDGGLRAQLEVIARDSSGAVRVLGPRDDVGRLLAGADMSVLSSRHEGLPYALLEAMAAGLPSVVADYPGAAEVLGDAGLLVPIGSVDGFAETIGRLAADAALRAELGDRARRRVESQFSIERMLEGTRRVYEQVIDDHGGSE
jgi:glycosyltransferase involved in cell wall biosynthesis